MGDEKYDIAAAVAAQITNLLGGDYPGGRAELFSKIVYLILDGIYEAEKSHSARRLRISDN